MARKPTYRGYTMTPLVIAGILAALVAAATALGFVWKSQNGRVRTGSGETITATDVPADLGERATLLQFSSEVCAPCVATHRVLNGVARSATGVAHLEVDVANRPDLASRFNILQTPTTLVLDERGVVRARIGGAARPDTVRAELDRILTAA
jgi:thiol-disulfide isomerase/thioredoxin